MRGAFISIVFALTIYSFLYAGQESLQLEKQANDFFDRDDCAAALTKFEQLLKIYEKSKESGKTGDVLYRMSVCYNNTADYQKAFDAVKHAETIHNKIGNITALGFDVTELARTEALRSNYKESYALAHKALQIHEQNNNKRGIADSLRLIAQSMQVLGEVEESLSVAERSLALSKEIGDKKGIGKSLRDIAQVYWNRVDYPGCLKYLEESLRTAEEAGDKRTVVNVIKNIAMVYGEQGFPARELENYERALKIAKEIGDLPSAAIILMNSGAVQYMLGNFGKSNKLLLEALAIAENIGNRRYVAGCLSNLAVVQFYSGNHVSGLNYLEKAIKTMEEVGDQRNLSLMLGNLGEYYHEHGDYEKAVETFEKSLRIRRQIADTEGTIWALNYLGDVYEKLANYDEALKHYKEAASLAEPAGVKNLVDMTYLGIGIVHYRKKDFAAAETFVDKAVQLASKLSDWPILWSALRMKARILSDTGRESEALPFAQNAVEVIESVRATIDLAERRAGYFKSKREAYEDLIALLLKTKDAETAFKYVQLSKARAFLDMLVEANVDPVRSIDASLIERKKQILKDLADVHNEIHKESENEKPVQSKIQELTGKRTRLEEQYSYLQLEIRNANPHYADLQYPQPMSLVEAQQQLDDQTVLMEYFIAETASYLFTITKNEVHTFILPGEKQLITQTLQLRDSLRNPKSTRYLELSRLLYSELLKPAESVLVGKQRLLISPDGSLNYLPFESLTTTEMTSTEPFPFLAFQYEIHYIPSISVLKAIRDKPASEKQKQLIAFANPLLNETREAENRSLIRDWTGTLGSLPHAKTEVEEIAKLYATDDVSIMIGQNASEQNVKTMNLDQYRRIHFASHGLIDEEKPEFSALVLSIDENREEDGFLTMREVFDLKLNANLVVLSACKTGLGQNIRGEGVSGLSRAFLVAGTSAVLVSLWDVYDRTTANFMKALYRHMEQHQMTKAEALKEVRREMIRNNKTSHPYYWAAFILIGDN